MHDLQQNSFRLGKMVNSVLLTSDVRLAQQIRDWVRVLDNDVRLEIFSTLRDFNASFDPVGVALAAETTATATDLTDGVPKNADQKNADQKNADQKNTNQQHSKDGPPAAGGHQTTSAKAETVPPEQEPLSSRTLDGIVIDRKPLRLLIIDLDLLEDAGKKAPVPWFIETRRFLENKGYVDPILPTRIVALSFDQSKFTPDSLRHESLDDLIIKPLDRELFLQKIEFLVADKPNVKPSFLFRQKTEMPIEAGKDAVVDELSEFTLAVRNPRALVNGLFLAVHSEIFGDGEEARLLARVFESVRHPVLEGEFLVRASFFGISAPQLGRVRKYVRAHQVTIRTKPVVSVIEQLAEKNRVLKSIAPQDFKKVAVIDMNRETLADFESIFSSHFLNVRLSTFASYSRFLGELAKLNPVDPKPTPVALTAQPDDLDSPASPDGKTAPAFPFGKQLSIIIDSENNQLIRFDPNLNQESLVLGRSVGEWLSRPSLWFNAIIADDREIMNEYVAYLLSGAHGHAFLRMTAVNAAVHYFDIKGKIEQEATPEAARQLRFELREIPEEAWQLAGAEPQSARNPSDFRFDAIYINGAALRSDLASWLIGLRELLHKTGVSKPEEPLPAIFLLCDEKSKLKPDNYRHSEVVQFIHKPLDRKYLADTAACLIKGIKRQAKAESSGTIPVELPVRLAKDVIMDELAEYGLTILQKSPLRRATYMRFFCPVFGTNSQGVVGRCAASVLVGQGDKAAYQCHFIFFGVTDELFRRIRTWIRDEYVHTKTGAES